MKTIHVPRIESRYWAGIVLASIFGTNTGDLFAHESGLGILGGLPILAAVVAIIYVLERRDSKVHEAWYWLAIIVIRTGATNIADFLCGRRHLGFDRVQVSIGLALMIVVLVWRRSPGAKSDLPQTDARYWTAMLAAGVFGTAAGDAVLGAFGGPAGSGGVFASAVLSGVLAIALVVGRNVGTQLLHTTLIYWATICIARTAGTAIADMLAENAAWNIGLPISTLCSGLAFVAVLLLWKPAPKVRAVSIS